MSCKLSVREPEGHPVPPAMQVPSLCFWVGVGLEGQPTGARRAAVVMGTDSEMKMLLLGNFSNRKLEGEAKPPSKFLLKKKKRTNFSLTLPTVSIQVSGSTCG